MGFLKLDGTVWEESSKPQPWGNYDFSKPSLAVVASDGQGEGAVLWTVGAHLNLEMEEIGLYRLDELGLDNAPLGISVWEGKGVWSRGPWEHPQDGDMELVGEFRDPTKLEWAFIKDNECPWNDEEWKLKDV